MISKSYLFSSQNQHVNQAKPKTRSAKRSKFISIGMSTKNEIDTRLKFPLNNGESADITVDHFCLYDIIESHSAFFEVSSSNRDQSKLDQFNLDLFSCPNQSNFCLYEST